jgi:hypothetical protein
MQGLEEKSASVGDIAYQNIATFFVFVNEDFCSPFGTTA